MKKIFFSPIFLLLLFCLCSCNNSDTGKSTQTEDDAVPQVKSNFINGDSIHYIDIGKGDPVVFVHGAVGDYRTWGAQMDEFAKNHRVISYSRRFAYPNQQTINDSAHLTVSSHSKDLAEFLKSLNLGKVHLVGHSFGASTALLTVLDHPELVHSLTLGEAFVPSLLLNEPGGDTVLNNFVTKTFMPVVDAFKNNNDEKAVNALITGVMGDSLYFARMPQNYQEIMMSNIPELKGITARQDIFTPVSCVDLKKITAPVLLLKGDKSPVIFSLMINELNRCLSNREIATLTNTSHGLEYESPVEFNKIVLGFIDKQY
ncbi:MAG: alpha/beta fold hydrolase [Flavitalea sp.]